MNLILKYVQLCRNRGICVTKLIMMNNIRLYVNAAMYVMRQINHRYLEKG